jgi:hypothetical protein
MSDNPYAAAVDVEVSDVVLRIALSDGRVSGEPNRTCCRPV